MADDFDFLSDHWGDDEWDGELDNDAWLSEPSSAEKAFLDEIFALYGIKNYEEVIIDFSPGAIDPRELRGDRFSTFAEAVIWLFDIGVLGFSNVVRYGDEDLFGVRIPDDTP